MLDSDGASAAGEPSGGGREPTNATATDGPGPVSEDAAAWI